MKAIFILITLVFVLIAAVPGCGESLPEIKPTATVSITPTPQDISNPKATVTEFLRAQERLDVNAVASCFTVEKRGQWFPEDFYEGVDSIEFSNIKLTVLSETNTDASVKAEYYYDIKVFGEIEQGHENEIINLTKVGNKWLIYSVADFQNSSESFAIDEETLLLAIATFYSDIHGGFNENLHTWGDSDFGSYDAGHYFPTYLGESSAHSLILNSNVVDAQNNPRVDENTLGVPADDNDINQHAIWMGLVVNKSGEFPPISGGSSKREQVSPLIGEASIYLWEIPESAGVLNGATTSVGSYTWIVGDKGVILGAYKAEDGYWYSGFRGVYP